MNPSEIPSPAVPASTVKDEADKLALHSVELEQLQIEMGGLLAQVARQTEQFRVRIADLLSQVETLRDVASDSAKEQIDRDVLVLQLRAANQNLVIATFDAQDLQAAAEAVNSRQEEFLAMLAHELRNPLAPIAMASEFLGTMKDAHPALPNLHEIIDRQVNTITQLVDDLLDVSRVRTGKITLHKHAFLLSEVIDGAIETSQPFANKRQQTLSVDLRLDLPPDLEADQVVIDGDLVRLTQAFSNLLINATKFTQEHGRITVSASRLANTVTVLIKDNGVGIAPELQPFIFDLFTQGPRSLDRSEGGLGIGLALVRTIVEMHGGTVGVYSEGTGFGSEFRIQLPVSAKRLPHHKTAAATEIPVRACRILVIEDNADTNSLLNNILAQEGHIMTSALNGLSGLALAKENPYDVIICDLGLPGMDGYEVIKQLRLHSSNPLPCLIAMTGYNLPASKLRATEAGFDHYLVKPVAMDNLRNLIPSIDSQ